MDNKYFYIVQKKFILTPEGENNLLSEFEKGKTQKEMADIFSVSVTTIQRWLKELGCKRERRIYQVNENYFESIDSDEKAYWLGFLSADGYIHEGKNTITLELQESDKFHIEKFKKAISATYPIKEIIHKLDKEYTHYRITITSKKMVNDLAKYNVIQNKSLIFVPPKNINKNYLNYWIAGYMDGDGCLWQARERFKICFTGTYETLSFIKNYFHSDNKISLEHRCKNTYKFVLDVDNSERFLYDIKYDELSYALERKRMRYCSFCAATRN